VTPSVAWRSSSRPLACDSPGVCCPRRVPGAAGAELSPCGAETYWVEPVGDSRPQPPGRTPLRNGESRSFRPNPVSCPNRRRHHTNHTLAVPADDAAIHPRPVTRPAATPAAPKPSSPRSGGSPDRRNRPHRLIPRGTADVRDPSPPTPRGGPPTIPASTPARNTGTSISRPNPQPPFTEVDGVARAHRTDPDGSGGDGPPDARYRAPDVPPHQARWPAATHRLEPQ
jgi:hypothetical protein